MKTATKTRSNGTATATAPKASRADLYAVDVARLIGIEPSAFERLKDIYMARHPWRMVQSDASFLQALLEDWVRRHELLHVMGEPEHV